MTIKINGVLEIDEERGVIYFHSKESGHSPLRICSLPKPIPDPSEYGQCLDITHMYGCNWEYNKSPLQPISTAPTDRYIIIYENGLVPDLACWQPKLSERIIGKTKYLARPEGWFRREGGRSTLNPTHWAEIPK